MSAIFTALTNEARRLSDLGRMIQDELARTRDAFAEEVAAVMVKDMQSVREYFQPIRETGEELAAAAEAIQWAADHFPPEHLATLETRAADLVEGLSEASTSAAEVITAAGKSGPATFLLVTRGLAGHRAALAILRLRAANGDELSRAALLAYQRIQTIRKRVRRFTRYIARLLAAPLIYELSAELRREHFPALQANAPPRAISCDTAAEPVQPPREHRRP